MNLPKALYLLYLLLRGTVFEGSARVAPHQWDEPEASNTRHTPAIGAAFLRPNPGTRHSDDSLECQ